MIYKSISSKAGHVRVTFELPSSIWANNVFVAGDFNEWQENILSMRQERDGAWRASIDLPIGQQYEFCYIVDGQRQGDYQADGSVSAIHGPQKSIIRAELPTHRVQKEELHDKVLLHRKAMMLREQLASRNRKKAHLPKIRSIA